jgi:hypothetical protein
MNRSGNGMNRALAVLIMLLVMPAPSAAYQYEPVSYVNSGVSITVSIRAKTSWTAPFAEAVNVSVIATPLVDGVVGVNITSVSIIVNSEQADQSSFILIAAAEEWTDLLLRSLGCRCLFECDRAGVLPVSIA